MKRIRFTLALLSASWLAGASVAQACDHCRTHGSKCNCQKECNDRGLFNAVDRVAGNIHHGIKKSLPKIELKADLDIFKRKSAPCDGEAGCSCEPTCGAEPTCGVEPTCGAEATCGSEMSAGRSCSCGCESGGKQHSHSHSHSHPHSNVQVYRSLTPGRSVIDESVQAPPAPGLMPPQPLATPFAPRNPFTPRTPSENGPSVPVRVVPQLAPEQLPTPHQNKGQGLPDSMVDPFEDDHEVSRHQTPAMRASYQRATNRYRQSYDPQASHIYRVKLIDSDESEPTPGMAPSVTTASAVATAPATYSRSLSSEEPTSSRRSSLLRKSDEAIAAQLTNGASSQQPAPIVRRDVDRLPTRSTTQPQTQPDYYANPLRP